MDLREIDRLVAEKVMGWKSTANSDVTGESVYRTKDDRVFVFNPSTNIADAWQVVEKMKEMHFSARVSFILELQRAVTPKELKDKNQLLDLRFMLFHLTPKAICLAALKTLEIDIEV